MNYLLYLSLSEYVYLKFNQNLLPIMKILYLSRRLVGPLPVHEGANKAAFTVYPSVGHRS